MRRTLLLAALLLAGGAGQDRPTTLPTRDVDITYEVLRPGLDRPVEQRLRWSAASGKQRVDLPPAMWQVWDSRAGRVSTVLETDHAVVEQDGRAAGLAGLSAQGGSVVRRGEGAVLGLSCTDWLLRDATGSPTLACFTADGVMLRAIAGGAVLIEAKRISFDAVEPGIFQVPDGYRRVSPPAAKRPAR